MSCFGSAFLVDGFEQTRLPFIAIMPWLSVLYLFHAGLTDRASRMDSLEGEQAEG